jgi:hypothetical protein
MTGDSGQDARWIPEVASAELQRAARRPDSRQHAEDSKRWLAGDRRARARHRSSVLPIWRARCMEEIGRARLDRACHILMFPAACRHALCTVIPERRIWGMLHGRLGIGHCGLCRHRHPDTHRSRRPRTVTRTIMLRLRPHDLHARGQVTRRCLDKTCFGSSL